MDKVTIRVGSATQSPGPERLEEIRELAELLKEDGRSVAIEEVELIPGRYGVIWAETLAIFIGSAAGSGLIGAIVADIYNTAKGWARDQFTKKKPANPTGRVRTQSFTLYDSDGKPLVSWKISDEGEQETVHEIESSPDDQSR